MSGRSFSKVSPALWRPGRFLDLPTIQAKLLYLYLLTCEHQNSAGAFRIPDGYACADIGWPVDEYRKARQALIEGEMIAFDPDTSEVFVLRWFRHNVPMNAKHQAGTMRLISEIESDNIREIAEAAFDEVTQKPGTNPLDAPLGNGSRLMETRLMRGVR